MSSPDRLKLIETLTPSYPFHFLPRHLLYRKTKSVPACIRLTSSLSSLARLHPRTKFLQVKASSIGFGSSSSSSSTKATSNPLPSLSNQSRSEDDEDEDEEEDKEVEDDEDYELDDEDSKDVLPTILIYRKGELEANLVRPDLLEEEWRGGDERGVREILIK